MRRRLRHWTKVFKRAFVAAGWVAGLVTVALGGSVLAAGVYLLHERHRVFAVVVVAAGVLAAVLEGSYRVWDATEKELETTRARLRELDTDEAKRAYLNEQIARAERLRQRIEAVTDDDWRPEKMRRTYRADIIHWEDGVRADLRESFEGDLDILFDSEEGFGVDMTTVNSRESEIAYLERRITRLRQIEEAL